MYIEKNKVYRCKDLALYLNVSESTAKRLYKDIKDTYKIKYLFLSHIKEYFKL